MVHLHSFRLIDAFMKFVIDHKCLFKCGNAYFYLDVPGYVRRFLVELIITFLQLIFNIIVVIILSFCVLLFIGYVFHWILAIIQLCAG